MTKILIVDDERGIRQSYHAIMSKEGYEVFTAEGYDESVEILNTTTPDVVVTDYLLDRGKNGLDLLRFVKEHHPDTEVVVMTGYPTVEVVLRSIRMGAFDFLVKPVQVPDFVKVVRLAAERKVKTDQDRQFLRLSEERYRQLVERSTDLIWRTDFEGRVLDVNPACRSFLGYSVSEAIGRGMEEYLTAESVEKLRGWVRDALQATPRRNHFGGEIEYVGKNQRRIMGDLRATLISDDSGQVVCVEGISRDITSHKREEDRRRESEKLFRDVYAKLRDGIVRLDTAQKITDCNPQFREMLDYTFDEISTLDHRDITPPCWHDMEINILREHVDVRGYSDLYEKEYRRKNGTVFPVEVQIYLERNTEGEKKGYWAFARDITKRVQTIEAMKESDHKYRLIADNLPNGMIYQILREPDGTRKFTFLSGAVQHLHGCSPEEAIADPSLIYGTVAEDERERLLLAEEHALATESVFQTENRIRKPGESEFRWSYFASKPRYLPDGSTLWDGVELDITDRKRAETQLLQFRKSESLARMAGAIAHRYNNILHTVLGNLEQGLEDVSDPVATAQKLRDAMRLTRRAAEFGDMMLTYLGQTVFQREPLDLFEVCRQSLTALQADAPHDMTWDIRLATPGPVIRANASQIQRVLYNLVINAREAMETTPRTLSLSGGTALPEEIPSVNRFPSDFQPTASHYAYLDVADTGEGISKTELETIFDPFFTTKFTGRGLGLPIALGLVRAHDGCITAVASPGHGSLFRVFLPLSTDTPPHAKATPKPEAADYPRGGTVLFVDDEPSARQVGALMLSRLGMKSLEAKDGADAVEVFRNHQNEICCVLCDLTMPRMNGWEALAALRQIRPDIPVILASGFDQAEVMAGAHSELPQVFLHKPYLMADLKNALAACWEKSQPPPSRK